MEYNSLGELQTPEDVQESGIDYSQDSFVVKLANCGYLNINPEFGLNGVTTGRFHIFYTDPVHGSSTFYIEMDNDLNWISESYPPFIDQGFIGMIGNKIESRDA